VEVTIGGLDIHRVQLYISGGVHYTTDHGLFKEEWEERTGQRGNANTVQNFGGTGVYMCDTKGIGYKIINLRFDCRGGYQHTEVQHQRHRKGQPVDQPSSHEPFWNPNEWYKYR
jgi:hypothetical protein